MSLTINLTQLKRKKKKDGTIPIYIRITEYKKSRYISTGISVLPKHWNSNDQVVRRSHRQYKVYNKALKRQVLDIETKSLELQDKGKLNASTLKNTFKKDDYNNLVSRAEKYHNSLKGSERYWEWKRFGVLLGNLKSFLGSKEVDINNIEADFIEDFQRYLLTEASTDKEGNPVGNNPNTVRRKLTSFRGFFNELYKSKEVKHDPFMHVDKVAEKSAEKTKLSLDQIQAIENLELEEGSELWHIRNYFMYSFYNAGIRFGDLCTLQWKNIVDGRLTYKMRKTGGMKSIRQLEPMEKILHLYSKNGREQDKFIFPILDKKIADPFELRKAIGSKNAQVNLKLKTIANTAGIQANVSFHVSRHSFAHFALKKGMDIYSISKALGHSDLKVTEEYLKSFDEELLDKGMGKLFE